MAKKDTVKKDKPTIKSISFPIWYQKELDYLNSQKNMSEYICELIREDMQRASESHAELTKRQIKQMVQEQVLKQLLALNTAPQTQPQEPTMDDGILDDYY